MVFESIADVSVFMTRMTIFRVSVMNEVLISGDIKDK